ncbi:hypothetical protein [Aurantiacibacter hainanensis]|uniref:hypothetical protein n=1 Tax=Aurantiacibacter hainanensis TaxID=3076114 RepID=UPI0030C6C5B1
MKIRALLLATLGSVALSPGLALAGQAGSFRLSTSVDTVCEFDARLDPLAPGSQGSVGTVSEYCNAGDAYQLVAEHRPLVSDENARMRFGNTRLSLNPSGETVLASRSGPVRRKSELRVDANDLLRPVVLTVTLSYI